MVSLVQLGVVVVAVLQVCNLEPQELYLVDQAVIKKLGGTNQTIDVQELTRVDLSPNCGRLAAR